MAPQTHVQPIAPIAPGALLAWSVEIRGYRCIVFAATKNKAQWLATKSYWEAYGRRKGEWPRAVAFRAARYDQSHLRSEEPRAWSQDAVLDSL